jgi:hypothetical protein
VLNAEKFFCRVGGLSTVLPRPRAEKFHEFGEGSGEEGGALKLELFQFCGYLMGVSIW